MDILEMKLGLETMYKLLALFSNPHLAFKTIHVAGTNGKGSVCTKIAKSLEYSGYKTGLYTSPHLHHFSERIRIHGECMDDDALIAEMDMRLQEAGLTPTFFERATLLAFLHFRKQKVDFAVIEVGLGGRLDATNVVQPVLTVITSISLDHTAYLGDSLELIAREKGGVIKKGVPVVLGPTCPDVLREMACERGALCVSVPNGVFSFYDEENQAIAHAALDLLGVSKGGLECRPSCRLEEVVPGVVLDVAHNPDGFRRTFEAMGYLYPGRKVHVLMGMSQDKDVRTCLDVARLHVETAHFVRTDYERLMDPVELKRMWQGVSIAYSSVREGVRGVLGMGRDEDVVLIMGSFFIMSEALTSIQQQYTRSCPAIQPLMVRDIPLPTL